VSDDLTPYNFGNTPVRIVMRDGEPWMVVNDICAALDIINTRNVVSRLDEDDVRQADVIDSMGRTQRTTIVNESGMYEIVLRSDKPGARTFRKWITSEVLPSIRKTGAYISAPKDDLDMMEDNIRALRAQRARIAAVEVRQDVMDSHLAGVLGQYDEFTTLAYAKLNGLPTDRASCQRHGQRASRRMRDRGQMPRKRQDASFGLVNIYPADVLEATAQDS